MDLAEEGVDLAAAGCQLPGHLVRTLFEFPSAACAAPDYLERHGVPMVPADLAKHELIGVRNAATGTVQAWRFRSRDTGASRHQIILTNLNHKEP